jgi:alanyl-tRNA synthetase
MADKTERLFEAHPGSREFDAAVVDLTALPEGQGVVLDKTLFYPEGGGQPSDTGALNGNRVTRVSEEGGAIVHAVEGRFQKGQAVHGTLDWQRRFDHTQQHSGQHLLSQAFIRTIGADTRSFHLGSEDATIDIEFDGLTDEDVQKIETEANRTVFENREVLTLEKNIAELEAFPLRKKPDLKGTVRIVEIKDYDFSPCCGTHVGRTGEIGPIKILRHEKYKGGTRVHFVCGFRAVRDHQDRATLVQSVSRILTAGEKDMAQVLEKWKEERKASEKRIQLLTGRAMEAEAEKLMRAAELFGEIKWVSAALKDGNPREAQLLVRSLILNENVVAVIAAIRDGATVYIARSANLDLDVRPLLEAVSGAMTARGGGNASWAQCAATDASRLEEGMQAALEVFRKNLKSYRS